MVVGNRSGDGERVSVYRGVRSEGAGIVLVVVGWVGLSYAPRQCAWYQSTSCCQGIAVGVKPTDVRNG